MPGLFHRSKPSSPAAPASRESGDRLFKIVYHTIRVMLSKKIIFLFGMIGRGDFDHGMVADYTDGMGDMFQGMPRIRRLARERAIEGETEITVRASSRDV